MKPLVTCYSFVRASSALRSPKLCVCELSELSVRVCLFVVSVDDAKFLISLSPLISSI